MYGITETTVHGHLQEDKTRRCRGSKRTKIVGIEDLRVYVKDDEQAG